MLKSIIAVVFILLSLSIHANIIISGTRFIYPSTEKTIAVQLKNPDDSPILVQSWLEQENQVSKSNKIPFIITPPLARIEPKSNQSLRIRYTGEILPQDRESLFYLNILDIPSKPKSQNTSQNYLQFTFRNRLKFFFRPNTLPYPVEESYTKVAWSLKENQLTIKNPTPYHITYLGLNFKTEKDGEVIDKTFDIDMIKPFSEQTITLKNAIPKATWVQWYLINDYGATQSGVSKLQ